MSIDRPNSIPWPPIIYLTAVVTGLAIGTVAPLPWVQPPLEAFLQAIGGILAISALGIDLITLQAFRRAQTTILPHRGASKLITDGPFAWSRNPIYVANTLLVFSTGLFFGKPWLIVFAFLGAYATQKLAIEREERHLEELFGQAWIHYKESVRRWI
jgi:protein-S-isoprenylcysteine O-methyltransferase Ste14